MKQLIIILLIFSANISVKAQTIKLFTIDKELSSSMINRIVQDQKGVIWIATENGLNRYDGAKFTVYKHDKENLNSILGDDVVTLFESNDGSFFVGYLNGLQRYNEEYDQFERIPMQLQSGEVFDAHVSSMIERKNGEILVGTSGQGVFVLRKSDNGYVAYQESYYEKCKFVNDMIEDSYQNVWIATKERVLYIKPDHSENCMTRGQI